MDMDIFDIAKAKNLFGGGGGKREGTAIPVGQPVERIYFNTNNTIEETNAILSQLTFVQTPLLEYPLYAICANTADGATGSFIIAIKDDTNFSLVEIAEIGTESVWNFYDPCYADGGNNGWVYEASPVNGKFTYVNAMSIYAEGQPLTDFNGIPIGAENEKIKNVLSVTPF